MRLAWQAGAIADPDEYLDAMDPSTADEWIRALDQGMLFIGKAIPESTGKDTSSIEEFQRKAAAMYG